MANKRKRAAYLATRNRGRGEKDNTEYWRDRAIEREALWNNKSRSTVEKELAEQYRKAALAIQDDIAVLYGRFATDNGLTLKEAKALLTGREFKEWRMSLEEYTALSAHDNAILRELNTLAMRPRISRLEKLHGDILQELYKLGKSTCKSLDTFLGDAYKDNYYKGLQEIGKTVGLQNAISAVSTKTLEGVLRTPWSGKNYSERIWTNHKRLADTLKDTISAGLHRGLSVPKLSQMVQERMGVGQHEATRLVRTELTYVHNQANLDSLKEGGFKYYKFVATLDKRTSSMCRDRDGEIIPIEDAAAGKSLPPLHPHCRSTIIGSLGEGKGGKSGSRIARDSKGNTLYVPRQMNYNDYKAVYIDRSKSFAKWAEETGFEGALAKYTPKPPIQDSNSGGIIEPKEPKEHSKAFDDLKQALINHKVEEMPVEELPKQLTSNEIIERLAGGDLTKGSCASLALAYIGNRHKLDVLDFRGGRSQDFFCLMMRIRQIANLPGVKAETFTVKREAGDVAKYLLSDSIRYDKEYYLATGKHAAIIRKTEDGLEYLELQSGRSNGWKTFGPDEKTVVGTLRRRFGCRKTIDKSRYTDMVRERPVIVMEVDSFADNEEFKEILGYINTAKDNQRKGSGGFEK